MAATSLLVRQVLGAEDIIKESHMNLKDLQSKIVQSNLDKYNIFTGSELGIMDIYIKKFLGSVQCERAQVDTVQEAYSKMTQRRMIVSPRCFIVIDDKEYLKQEKIWPRMQSAATASEDYVILVYTNMDKRSKFYKANQEVIVEFDKLSPEMLAKYIDKELPGMTEKERVQLAEICECDYSRVMLECDKIRQFSKALNRRTDDGIIATDYMLCFKELVTSGVIYQPVGDITFKFTDAIALRHYDDIAKYLYQAKLKQEPEIMVLSILYNTFKQILLVQGLGNDQNDAAKRTGLTPWQVKLAKEKQDHYSIRELINALKIIRFTEKAIKTGQIDADTALEYVIIHVVGGIV
jgi:DNA polymerase III delta subunit